MKLVVLALSVVCMLGYCEANNHIKMIAQKALPGSANTYEGAAVGTDGLHTIIRRQTSTTTERCANAVLGYQCTSGLGEELVATSIRCGDNSFARAFAGVCARNENDEYCGAAATAAPEIPSSCTFFGSCPSECRSYLQTIRGILGCCINSLLNFTDNSPEVQEILSYSLWSSCGVETIEGSCNNGIDFTPATGGRVCSVDELHQDIAELECNSQFSDGILNAFRNEGICSQQVRFLQDACTVNSNGDLCAGEARDDTLAIAEGRLDEVSITPIVDNCGSVTTFCPSSCRTALQNFRRELGCCADTIYSNPDHPAGVIIPSALWDFCNVDNPGQCTATSNGNNNNNNNNGINNNRQSNSAVVNTSTVFSLIALMFAGIYNIM